jgi:hypothetical protein
MLRLILFYSLLAAPAFAATEKDLAPAFRNTIVSTYPSGRSAKLWLNRDGSYTGQGAKGGRTAGKWSIKGDDLCLRQTKPFGLPIRYCTPIVKGGVGTRWSARSPKDEPLRNRLVAGRAGA